MAEGRPTTSPSSEIRRDPSSDGRVLALFVYPASRSAPQALESVRVHAGRGLEGDHRRSAHRSVTLLSLEQWREVESELGVRLPPETRRANVVVSGIRLPETIGKRLRLGEVEIEVLGEVAPCERMDEAHMGLREALRPGLRGGVHGRVIREGVLRAGDAASVIEPGASGDAPPSSPP